MMVLFVRLLAKFRDPSQTRLASLRIMILEGREGIQFYSNVCVPVVDG
jgi:hypothetical protein